MVKLVLTDLATGRFAPPPPSFYKKYILIGSDRIIGKREMSGISIYQYLFCFGFLSINKNIFSMVTTKKYILLCNVYLDWLSQIK